MRKGLIIVESPAKARTITRMAGKGYQVLASNGHVRDLPKSKLGVDLENGFEPHYVTIRSKSKVINQLREKASNVDEIYLAPDPDREGEAIAWHLMEVLKQSKRPFRRLVFHEITERAIQEALASPREINMDKVNAQQARRVLDRLVGYQLSPVLWKTIRYGLSAGRVQSVALRLIVDREAEIAAFTPEEYWTIHAVVSDGGAASMEMGLVSWEGAKPRLKNEQEAQAVLDRLADKPLTIQSIATKRRRRNPSAPFITSTLQQDAFRALRFSSKKTMQIAQELYEGLPIGEEGTVGLITYMRTDSTRIADEAIGEVRGFIESTFGQRYLPEKPNVYRKKTRSQDAHEAIRPTSSSRSPEALARYLSADQLKLYRLIWNRFVASQMRPQELDITTVDAGAAEGIFRATGRVVAFDGFTRLYESSDRGANRERKGGNEKNGDEEKLVDLLPGLREGQALAVNELRKDQHFTEPPPRYSEASLIRALEENGIGRPSTYSTIVSTILTRDYVRRDKGRLFPTDLGVTVTGLLVENFERIMNVDFTAHMEEELDSVEAGQDAWEKVVREFYEPFAASLHVAESKVKELKASVQVETDQVCSECGAKMVRKFGRNGPFLACSRYPECKHTEPLSEDEKPKPTDHPCPTCGTPMMIRTGRYGRFLACSRYPDCKTTLPVPVGVDCPEEGCAGKLVEKRTRGGRVFYGCDAYPKCRYALWDLPVNRPCPACGHPFMVAKETRREGPHYACPKCKIHVPREHEEEEAS